MTTSPGDRAPAPARRVTRRNFIVWYLAGLLTATAAAIVAPLLVYLWPPSNDATRKPLKVSLPGPIDQIAPGSALSFQSPSQTGFVMVDGGGDNGPGHIGFRGYLVNHGGTLIMLSATCSHLGCQINFESATHDFHCPCHGSHFSIDGRVTHGPATAPLSHYAWRAGASPDQVEVIGVPTPGTG